MSDSVLEPFKRTFGSPAVCHVIWMESLLIFKATCCGEFSYQSSVGSGHFASQKIKTAEAYPACLGFLNTTAAIDFCI